MVNRVWFDPLALPSTLYAEKCFRVAMAFV